MADYEKALVRGVGETLAAESFLAWVDPDGDGAYTDAQAGLYLGAVPSTPRRAVAMNSYTVAMHPTPIVGVQFHFAAYDPDDLTAMAQAVSDVLEGRWGGMLGTVRLVASAWQSGTSLGQDANGREQRTENYYLTIARSIPNR
ncbi:tail terminator [Microbacterium phage Gingerbug]|nr:tail terminator [Microbacterium phage Gingerbug]